MRSTSELLSQYAQYHRDRRNIATHFVGVPLIVMAVGTLLSRAAVEISGQTITLAMVVWVIAGLWYVTRGSFTLGVAVSMKAGILFALGSLFSGGSLVSWLAWGLGIFFVGWVIQFVGHYYEGRKPAFVDDLVGLLVGPMFVTAEAMFLLGWNKPLLAEIEGVAGPTIIRDLTKAKTA